MSTDRLELTTVTFISSLVVNVALCCLESARLAGGEQNEEDTMRWTTDAETNMPSASTRKENYS